MMNCGLNAPFPGRDRHARISHRRRRRAGALGLTVAPLNRTIGLSKCTLGVDMATTSVMNVRKVTATDLRDRLRDRLREAKNNRVPGAEPPPRRKVCR